MILSRPPGSDPHSPELRRRFGPMLWVIALALLLLAGRLWQLQVIRGDRYYERARSNVVKTRRPPAVRGRILDRRGRVLADSRPAFDILVDPSEVDPDELDAVIRELHLDSGEADLVRRRVERARQRGVREPTAVLERQSRERAALIRQMRYRIPGLDVIDGSERVYPNGKVAAHLLGYLNQPTGLELRRLASDGYQLGDVIGRFGLERRYEPYLRGKRGIERYLVNAAGDRVDDSLAGELDELIDGPAVVPPVPGHDLHLTLDLELEKVATEALADHAAGAVVVVEVATGRILAMVSKPAFDPNAMTGGLSVAEETELYGDPRHPFIDKTMRQHYPPGSTFKAVTAIAALESGLITTGEKMSCPGVLDLGGRVFHCDGVHGSLDIVHAIQRSCNVFFWKLAQRVGLDRIAAVARQLGFGQVTGLDLNDEVPGVIPDEDYYKKRGGYHIGYALNAAIGQGDVAVTVLQLAMAYAAIANGGTLYMPQIVERMTSVSGEDIARYEPVVRRKLELQPGTLETVRRGMFLVVNAPGGTANRYAGEGAIEMSGKTGTAQVRSVLERNTSYEGWHPHENHAWFAGFAPSSHPEIAFAVLIEHGGFGGHQAAPVARKLVESYFASKAKEEPR